MWCPDTSLDTAQAEAQNEAQRQTQLGATVKPSQLTTVGAFVE